MQQFIIGAALALGLSGCIFGGGDPIEGSWQGDALGNCTPEFTIDVSDGDVYSGAGDFCFQAQDGTPVKCNGDVEFTRKREGEYDFEVDFSGQNGCDQLADFEGECELKKDDTELDCGTNGGEWDLVED